MKTLRTAMAALPLALFCVLASMGISIADAEYHWKDMPLTPQERAWLAQNNTIRTRIAYWPPYQFWKNGPQGISVDYLQRIAQHCGLNIQFYQADESWTEALDNIRDHRRPDLITTIHHTPEREKFIAFTADYLSIPWVIFNRKDGDFIGGMEDLAGKTVAVQHGFIMQGLLEENYPKIRLNMVNDTLEALTALSTGKVDAFIGNLAVGTHILQEHGLTNVKVAAPTPFENHTQAFGIRDDWPELASIISKAIEATPPELRSDIRQKWLSVRYEYGVSWTIVGLWGLALIATASIIIAVILYSHRRLKEAHRTLREEVAHRQAIQVELEKLSRAVENSPAMIVITDLDGCIEYVNPAFVEITGYRPEEVLGTHPKVLRSEMHAEDFYAEIWKTVASGGSWRGEICSRKKNGELFWEQTLVAPIKDDQGRTIKFVQVKEDISDKKNLEQLKEDVDRIMRHDLKNPLNGIIGLAHILKQDGGLDEEQLMMVDMLSQTGWNMLRMIDLSLDLFKIETGRYEYAPENADVLHELTSVITQKQTEIATKNLTVRLSLDGAPPEKDSRLHVASDKRLLFSILANVVSNAMEASPRDETIEIGMQKGTPTVVSISNRGAVPKAIREAFFQKYVTYGKNSGTGLGTYSAKLMAEAMGYELQMETWDEDDRTEVRIVIPEYHEPSE